LSISTIWVSLNFDVSKTARDREHSLIAGRDSRGDVCGVVQGRSFVDRVCAWSDRYSRERRLTLYQASDSDGVPSVQRRVGAKQSVQL